MVAERHAERHAVFVRGEVGVCATSADEGRNAFILIGAGLSMYMPADCGSYHAFYLIHKALSHTQLGQKLPQQDQLYSIRHSILHHSHVGLELYF